MKKILRQGWNPETFRPDEDWEEASAAMMVTHRPRCSGYCCGNPRKHFGKKTRQEIKFEQGEEG